ncbi:MAG: hypothetical protein ACHQU0_03420 [Candidatus Paceibacteria bacterium]
MKLEVGKTYLMPDFTGEPKHVKIVAVCDHVKSEFGDHIPFIGVWLTGPENGWPCGLETAIFTPDGFAWEGQPKAFRLTEECVEGWVNVYKKDSVISVGEVHPSENEANKAVAKNYTAQFLHTKRVY